jgi:adenylate kinase family enzyme
MQRIVVMGPPGSGKSTLARRLGAKLGLPVFHLDQFYWQPGWIETPSEVFVSEVERISRLPAWVIDGNYTHTITPRLRAADTVIYLDVPAWLSVLRIVCRTLLTYGRVRKDAAPGCVERFDAGFLRFAWSWNRLRRTRSLALVESFSGRTIVVRSRTDKHRLLSE